MKGIDIDLLKDKELPDYGVEELEKMIGEVYYGRNGGDGRSLDKKWSYPTLNEEEMRMLSDEPKVVEKYEEFYLENEVRLFFFTYSIVKLYCFGLLKSTVIAEITGQYEV